MNLTQTIANFVHSAVVPAVAREPARIAIIDCIACMIAGARTETAQILLAALDASEGPATLLGLDRGASVRDAALINGTTAHALDYDDISWSLYGHPSVAVLPAILAVAENEDLTADELIDAYAVGVEVAAKLGLWANPAHYLRGWHATATLGVFGAAAGVARLKRLPPDRIAIALAIAGSLAAGVRENFGTMTKPFHAGRASEAGLLSAMLAEADFTGNTGALDGRFGFFQVLGTERTPSPLEFESSLGQPWEVLEPGIVLKRYPSCGATHCALDALLALKAEASFTAKDVVEIRCGAEQLALKVLQYARPATGLEGKFSMQFCLALATINGQPRLCHFTDEWAKHPAIVGLIPRVILEERADLGKSRNDSVPAEVAVRLSDGRVLRRTAVIPIGDPRSPMSETDRREKFLDCAGNHIENAEEAWSRLQSLTGAHRLAPILDCLRGVPRNNKVA